MTDFGSFNNSPFAEHTPDDYTFGGPDSQYYPPLIFSPADPPMLAPDFGHLASPLDTSYSQPHVRPPNPRIDTSTHIYQTPSLLVDQSYNNGFGMPYHSPGVTPSTASSHLPTPELPFHRQHVNIMSSSYSPISPSVSLYEPTVRLACFNYGSFCSSAPSILPPSGPYLQAMTIVPLTFPNMLILRYRSLREKSYRLPTGK